MQNLLSLYNSIKDLPHEEAHYHVYKFKKVIFTKKPMILTEGMTDDYLYFIDKGIIRFFL